MAILNYIDCCGNPGGSSTNGSEARETPFSLSSPTLPSCPLEGSFLSSAGEKGASSSVPYEIVYEDIDLVKACDSFAAPFRASGDALFTDAQAQGVYHEGLIFSGSEVDHVRQHQVCGCSWVCETSEQSDQLLRNTSEGCGENSDDNFRGFVASKATEEQKLFAAWAATPCKAQQPAQPCVVEPCEPQQPSAVVEAPPRSCADPERSDEGSGATDALEASDLGDHEPEPEKGTTPSSAVAGKARKIKVVRHDFCRECGATSTPQWREGPEGPRTLCNRCGVRYKKSLKTEQRTRQSQASSEFTKRQRVH